MTTTFPNRKNMTMKTAFPIRLGTGLAIMLLPVLALAATVPAAHCQQPTPPPKQGASAPQIDAYNKALPKYRKCIQSYVAARTDDAKKYSALAQQNSQAATKAVNEFNSFVKSVNNGR